MLKHYSKISLTLILVYLRLILKLQQLLLTKKDNINLLQLCRRRFKLLIHPRNWPSLYTIYKKENTWHIYYLKDKNPLGSLKDISLQMDLKNMVDYTQSNFQRHIYGSYWLHKLYIFLFLYKILEDIFPYIHLVKEHS